MSTMLSDKPSKLSRFTHHLQAPLGWTRDLGALAQPSIRHRRTAQPRNVKALDLCSPGACQRCAVKVMNGCHISKALADLGSYWQAHHSQHVSQLITSNFIFLVNTSWQIGHYLFILQQWALLLFWWCLEVSLLLALSSHPERNEELWEMIRKKLPGKGGRKGTKGRGLTDWIQSLFSTTLTQSRVDTLGKILISWLLKVQELWLSLLCGWSWETKMKWAGI